GVRTGAVPILSDESRRGRRQARGGARANCAPVPRSRRLVAAVDQKRRLRGVGNEYHGAAGTDGEQTVDAAARRRTGERTKRPRLAWKIGWRSRPGRGAEVGNGGRVRGRRKSRQQRQAQVERDRVREGKRQTPAADRSAQAGNVGATR